MQDKKLYSTYLGIDRSTCPKWNGWTIIQEYKDIGVHPKDIYDLRLECCVQNFHFLIEIANKLNINLIETS